jgi:mannose-6-phosphate isomerase
VSIVDKPWGHELIWARTDRYVGKILHIRAGEALSLQYHRVKDETIMLLRGRMQLIHFAEGDEPRSRDLVPNEPFHTHRARPAPSHDRDRGYRCPRGLDARAR